MNQIFFDEFFTNELIAESLLFDNDNIKNKINSYDKDFASDQDFINKFKSITGGYEIIGIPYKVTVSQYGIEVSRNFTIFCTKNKKVFRTTVTVTCLANMTFHKPKCTSVKEIKFNKNSNKDLFFRVVNKCKGKAVIQNITVSSKKINIYFYQCGKAFLEDLGRMDFNAKTNNITSSVTIYNKLQLKESADLTEAFSLAATNPIVAIRKPFILKLKPMNSIFSGNNFAFSPDIVSDKYLVINENNKLEIVDSEYLDNYSYSIYEFVGNELRLGLLYKAYKEQQEVSNNFIYSCLSDKDMFSEDQIDFDDQFKLVNLESYLIPNRLRVD